MKGTPVPRSQRVLTVAAVVVILGVIVAGTATATTRYIITKVTQISPTVRSALKTPSFGAVANNNVPKLGTSTRVVAIPLHRAPAAATGVVVFTNTGSADATVTCSFRLGTTTVSPKTTITVPAASSGSPLGGGGSSADTAAVTLAAGPTKTGVLGIFCGVSDATATVSASGTLTAVSVTSLVVVKPSPTPTASASASASASPSASATPSPTGSASASASPSASGSASPSASSSCPLPGGVC